MPRSMKTVWGGANYELKVYGLEFRGEGVAASFVYGRMAA